MQHQSLTLLTKHETTPCYPIFDSENEKSLGAEKSKQSPQKMGKSFTNMLTQIRSKPTPTKKHITIAVVHNRFSSPVNSETNYSPEYCPKTRY